jgi:hypothetical protein
MSRQKSIRELAHYTASDYRNFIYFGPIFLQQTLKAKYFEHFCLFSTAIRLLTLENCPNEVIDDAKELLIDFVKKFKTYYPALDGNESLNIDPSLMTKKNMTYNLHCHLHFAEQVKKFGPLHHNSCFAFEGFFKVIKSWIGGFTGIPNQIKQYIKVKNLIDSELKQDLEHRFMDPRMKEFLTFEFDTRIDSKIIQSSSLDELEMNMHSLYNEIKKLIGLENDTRVNFYEKLVRSNVYYRKMNEKLKDCCVKFGETFGMIKEIISINGQYFIWATVITYNNRMQFSNSNLIKNFKSFCLIDQEHDSIITALVELNTVEKCIMFKANNKVFISTVVINEHD